MTSMDPPPDPPSLKDLLRGVPGNDPLEPQDPGQGWEEGGTGSEPGKVWDNFWNAQEKQQPMIQEPPPESPGWHPFGPWATDLVGTGGVAVKRYTEEAMTGVISLIQSVAELIPGVKLHPMDGREFFAAFANLVEDPLSFFNKSEAQRIKEAQDRAERYTNLENHFLSKRPGSEVVADISGITGSIHGFVMGAGAAAGGIGRVGIGLATKLPGVSKVMASSKAASKTMEVMAQSLGFGTVWEIEDKEFFEGVMLGAAFNLIGTMGKGLENWITPKAGVVAGRGAAGFLEGSVLLPFAGVLEKDYSFLKFVEAVANGENIDGRWQDFLKSGLAFAIFKNMAPALAEKHQVREVPSWVIESAERGMRIKKNETTVDMWLDEREFTMRGNKGAADLLGMKGKQGVAAKGEEAEVFMEKLFEEGVFRDIQKLIPTETTVTQDFLDKLPMELREGQEILSQWITSPIVAKSGVSDLKVASAQSAIELAVKGDPNGDVAALVMSPEFQQAALRFTEPTDISDTLSLLSYTAAGEITAERALQLISGVPEVRDVQGEEIAPRQQEQQEVKDVLSETVRPGSTISYENAVAMGSILPSLPMEAQSFGKSVVDVAGKVVPPAARAFSRGISLWHEPLLDRVARQNEVGQVMAQLGRRAVDESRRDMGRAEPLLTSFLEAQKKGPIPKELNEYVEIHEEAWGTKGQMAADKLEEHYDNLSPSAQKVVDQYHQMQLETGRWFVEAGAKIKVKTKEGEEKWIDFSVDPNRWRFIRNYTTDAWDLFAQPGSPAYETLLRVLADINNIPELTARKGLDAMRERGLFRRDAAEIERVFEHFPSAIKVGTGVGARKVPMLNTNFAMAGQQLVRHAAMRSSFIKHFGQDTEGKGEVNKWVNDFTTKGGGTTQDAVNLIRALNGMPLEVQTFFNVGSIPHTVYRWLKLADGLRRTGLLTRAFIPNIPEPLGNVPAFVGARRLAKAYGEILAMAGRDAATKARTGTVGTESKGLWRELARMGSLTTDVMNWTFREGRKPEDIGRIARQLNFPLRWASEWNDLVSARAAQLMAEDLKVGHGTEADRVRLELLKFSPEEVESLMSGKAPTSLYNSIVSRSPAFTQFMDAMPAESSRLRGSRRWNALFFAEMFAQGKFRRWVEINGKMHEALQSKDWGKIMATGQIAGEFYLGSAASGALSTYGKLVMTFGFIGLFEEEGGLVDWAWYAIFGGVFSALERVFEGLPGEEAPIQKIAEIATPISGAMELYNLWTGQGAYSNKGAIKDWNVADSLSTFLDRNVAISRNMRKGLASIGLGSVDRKMDMALSKYYQWRRDNAPITFNKSADQSADARRFRLTMKKLTDEFKKGLRPGDDSVGAMIREAVQIKGGRTSSIGASLSGKRLFSGQDWNLMTPDQRQELQDYVGENLWGKLLAYDTLLRVLGRAYR